jgi:hypothetical protein
MVLVGFFHGVGIVVPSRRQRRVAGLGEDRAPPVATAGKEPETVNEYDWGMS